MLDDRGTDGAGAVSLTERVRSLRLNNARQGAPGRVNWFPWILCLILAAACAYLGWEAYGAAQTVEQASKDSKPGLPPANKEGSTAGQPGRGSGRVALEAGGYIVPVRKVQVSPKVGGQIEELFIEEGMYVKKGQVLAKLDKRAYEFEYQRTAAVVGQMKARYDEMINGNREEERKQSQAALHEAEELRNQLKDEFARLRKSGNATSIDELVKIESRLRQADFKVEQLRQVDRMMQDGPRQERVAAAKAEYEHAAAQRDKAKYDLDNCDVLAPVDGVILAKLAEVGDTVLPNVPSNGLSASVCRMADLRDLEVDVDISERDLNSVFKGQSCEIVTEAFPDKVYPGQVARLMPEAVRSKASVSARVRIQVPPGDVLLRPEMRARVRFLAPTPASTSK